MFFVQILKTLKAFKPPKITRYTYVRGFKLGHTANFMMPYHFLVFGIARNVKRFSEKYLKLPKGTGHLYRDNGIVKLFCQIITSGAEKRVEPSLS